MTFIELRSQLSSRSNIIINKNKFFIVKKKLQSFLGIRVKGIGRRETEDIELRDWLFFS